MRNYSTRENGISYKKFNKDEYFFKGHFPNNPIVPGVIIVEAMAQTAGIVVSYKLREYKKIRTFYEC